MIYGTRTGDIPRLSSRRIYPKSLFCGFYGGSQRDSGQRFEIFADTMKLIGNSAYGSMIMNK